jgi:hypothetical protein
MILECFRTGSGIRFRKEVLNKIGMDQNTLASLSDGQFKVERARPQRFATEDTVVPISPQSLFPFPIKQDNGWLHEDSIKGTGTDIEKETPDSKGNAPELPTIKEMATKTGGSAFETEQELKDALSPIYDQLKIWKIWWLPEVIPLRHRVHCLGDLKALRGHHWSYASHCFPREQHVNVRFYRVNLGRPRNIRKPNREGEKILVHRSVELRMNAEKSKLGGKAYKPRAKFDPEEIEWVE